MTPIRVMLCDDSLVARGALARLLAVDPSIQVVAQAPDGHQAIAALGAMPAAERPHVVGMVATLSDAAPENDCRPAVDPLLRSLLACCGGRVATAILTGMGQDGLAGCRALAATGGLVLAQDEASSVVWGMPGAVARAGLAAALGPPKDIAARLLAACAGAGA